MENCILLKMSSYIIGIKILYFNLLVLYIFWIILSCFKCHLKEIYLIISPTFQVEYVSGDDLNEIKRLSKG